MTEAAQDFAILGQQKATKTNIDVAIVWFVTSFLVCSRHTKLMPLMWGLKDDLRRWCRWVLSKVCWLWRMLSSMLSTALCQSCWPNIAARQNTWSSLSPYIHTTLMRALDNEQKLMTINMQSSQLCEWPNLVILQILDFRLMTRNFKC